MRIYEYNENAQTLNTECGLFHIGDFDDKCGMPLYLSEYEIDDMCRVE